MVSAVIGVWMGSTKLCKAPWIKALYINAPFAIYKVNYLGSMGKMHWIFISGMLLTPLLHRSIETMVLGDWVILLTTFTPGYDCSRDSLIQSKTAIPNTPCQEVLGIAVLEYRFFFRWWKWSLQKTKVWGLASGACVVHSAGYCGSPGEIIF